MIEILSKLLLPYCSDNKAAADGFAKGIANGRQVGALIHRRLDERERVFFEKLEKLGIPAAGLNLEAEKEGNAVIYIGQGVHFWDVLENRIKMKNKLYR